MNLPCSATTKGGVSACVSVFQAASVLTVLKKTSITNKWKFPTWASCAFLQYTRPLIQQISDFVDSTSEQPHVNIGCMSIRVKVIWWVAATCIPIKSNALSAAALGFESLPNHLPSGGGSILPLTLAAPNDLSCWSAYGIISNFQLLFTSWPSYTVHLFHFYTLQNTSHCWEKMRSLVSTAETRTN